MLYFRGSEKENLEMREKFVNFIILLMPFSILCFMFCAYGKCDGFFVFFFLGGNVWFMLWFYCFERLSVFLVMNDFWIWGDFMGRWGSCWFDCSFNVCLLIIMKNEENVEIKKNNRRKLERNHVRNIGIWTQSTLNKSTNFCKFQISNFFKHL